MSDDERELRKRLAPGPPARPPEGLLEKLKADIPERLPANVRPLRRAMPVTALRIAATLFLAGGALFVLTHRPKSEPAAPVAAETRPAPEAPRVAEGQEREPAAPTVSQPAAPKSAAKKLEKKTDNFAPPMPAPAAPERVPAPRAAEQPRPAAKPDVDAVSAPAEPPETKQKKEQAASEPVQDLPREAMRRAEKSTGFSPQGAGSLHAAGEGSSAPRRTSTAVVPTPGSLLADALGGIPAAAAARDGRRVFVLLSLPRAKGAVISAEEPLTILSAATLPDGGLVVLASTDSDATPVTLRSDGDRRSSASAAASLDEASVDLRLAVLAWRLERARGEGDEAARESVSRDAAALARVDRRASRIVELASR